MSFKYPEARRDETVKDSYFGTEITDPYRWLEDPDAQETQKFVDDQNAVTRPYLEGCVYKEEMKNKIKKLWNYTKVSAPFRHGNRYFQYRNTGLQNQSVIYVQKDLDSEANVFLDPNLLSEDGTVALSGTAFSEDGKTFAYGLSSSGSDWLEIKFKDVETGKEYDEILKKVKFSPMTWMHDNKGFFYGAYLDQTGKADGSETKSNENQKLYYHELGSDQSNDIVVVEFDDPQLRIGAHVSDCGNYLVISATKGCKNNLLYFAKLNTEKISGKLKLTEVVGEFTADYEYITNDQNIFYFHTNKNASNYRIVSINFDNPVESEWKDLISEHSKDVLDWAHAINEDMLVVCYLQDVKNILQLYDLRTGNKLHDFKLDVGTISAISGKKHHKEMFYCFCSFLTPNIIFRVNFDVNGSIKESLFHETKVGKFEPSKYETRQVFYKSKDGTEIPMFIINKKGLVNDGTKPCLLYGYGGFNINLTPSFVVSRLIFIENFDGVYALANIRGGGEYGDNWHNAGRFGNKQNCFDDFQYAARYLVENKYTNVDKLIIQGGSNGGLLVAACINQAPNLFGAAICQVGVLDMLRFHKFTIGYAWKSDYGCSEEQEQFEYLYRYSPLHNINLPKNGQYPATLLLTADHDDRVVPLHSLKFIAELQYKIGKLASQTNPLMIRIETRAGHGKGKPTSKVIEEVTDTFCFISRALNLTFLS
ncbi:prolyl endopeptidase isoform X2 [Zophobas morio]